MMNFLAPAAFILAVLLPIIIAMYLLKLRRTEQVVSSVYLWKRMVRDLEANAPWQRLRRNPLLLLQLLFLSALIFALAQPFTWTEGASGQSVIFILDSSASMAAVDTVPNRLEAAKNQARQMVDGLPDDARVTVISASDQAQVLISSSRDRRQIYQGIESIQISSGGSDLSPALGLASAIAARQPDTEVIILSDGRVSLPQRLSIRGRVRYFPIGLSADNQAVSLLSLETKSGAQEITAFAQITNYSNEEAQRRVELYADGLLFNAYDLEIQAGGQQAVVAENVPMGTSLVSAALAGTDAFPLDDQAWAVAVQAEPVPVTLVTEGNRFLETGLSLLPGFEVITIKPDEYEAAFPVDASRVAPAQAALDGPAQITIFDAYTPVSGSYPEGSLLFIAPPRSTEYFTVTGNIDFPVPRVYNLEDPLLANLNLSQVNILDAVQVTQPDWSRRVIEGETGGNTYPLLTVGSQAGRRVGVLAFDIRRSDLPLQVAFPILLANLGEWLSPGRSGELPGQVLAGGTVALSLPPETSSAIILRPDQSRVNLPLEGGRGVFADTAQLGVYRVTWGTEGEANFAVNLFSTQESDILPAQDLPVLASFQEGDSERPMGARREWWRPVAFIALAFLVIEWLVYQRATLARLFGRKPNKMPL
jgi:Ca-activated chloride channel homolog